MKIVERQVGDVVVLDLHGKILIGEGDDALRDAVTRLVDSGKTKILLNLADVPYVDSAGLGEIVRCYTTVSRKGGKLKLMNLTKKIQDLLAITKLLTVFETYDSEDEAVKSFLGFARGPRGGPPRRSAPAVPPQRRPCSARCLSSRCGPTSGRRTWWCSRRLAFSKHLFEPTPLAALGARLRRSSAALVGRRLPPERRGRRGARPAAPAASGCGRWPAARCAARRPPRSRPCLGLGLPGRCPSCWGCASRSAPLPTWS